MRFAALHGATILPGCLWLSRAGWIQSLACWCFDSASINSNRCSQQCFTSCHLLPRYCQDHGIGVQAYSPLTSGRRELLRDPAILEVSWTDPYSFVTALVYGKHNSMLQPRYLVLSHERRFTGKSVVLKDHRLIPMNLERFVTFCNSEKNIE